MSLPVFLFDDHSDSYCRWKDAGLRGLTAVHVDAHLDLKDEGFTGTLLEAIAACRTGEELAPYQRKDELEWYGFHLGNYLYPAVIDGTVTKIIWVIPPHLPGGGDLLEWAGDELATWKDLTIAEYLSLGLKGGKITGTLAGAALEICRLEDLDACGERLVWDLDVDYFFDRDDSIWLSPVDFAGELKRRAPNPLMATVAYSVGGGYTSPHQRFVGDLLKMKIQGCLPESLAAGLELVRRGDALLCRGDGAGAWECFDEAGKDPFYRPFIHLRKAQELQEKGDWEEAGHWLQKAGEHDPSLAVSDFDRAMMHLRRRNYAAALSLLERIEGRGLEEFSFSCFFSALIHVEKGDFKAAGESFLRLANHRNFGRLIDGVQAHVLFAAGINCLRLEEMEKAAELFSRALAIRPDNARAFSGRGHALAGMGCLPEAAADYERFLSLRYDYLESIDVHLTLGQIYRLMGKISRERLELQRVREKGFARLIP